MACNNDTNDACTKTQGQDGDLVSGVEALNLREYFLQKSPQDSVIAKAFNSPAFVYRTTGSIAFLCLCLQDSGDDIQRETSMGKSHSLINGSSPRRRGFDDPPRLVYYYHTPSQSNY